MALSFDARTRLLVVAPHPDDESLGCGQLLRQVLEAGGRARVLLLTDGDNNPWPQRWLERRWRIGAAERRRWALRRQGELAGALAALGLPAEALQRLGWADLGVTDRLLRDAAASIDTVAARILTEPPTVLALPALADSHPDHSAGHVLVRLALAKLGLAPDLLSYLVHGRSEGAAEGEELVLTTTADRLARKLAALEHHTSQTALSGERLRRFARREESYRWLAPSVASEAATATALPWSPPTLWRPWLRLSLAGVDGVRSWPWLQAPLRRDGGGYVLHEAVGRGPCFVKLSLQLPSPWIFDHWGWRRL